jgi:hypothetical protein
MPLYQHILCIVKKYPTEYMPHQPDAIDESDSGIPAESRTPPRLSYADHILRIPYLTQAVTSSIDWRVLDGCGVTR